MGRLNALGAKGWEIVSVVPIARTGMFTGHEGTHAFSFVFKRASEQRE